MERLTLGVVLTAGSQEKQRGGHRIEPDLEGKLRIIPAIDELSNGQIDRILIAGGAKNYNTPLAHIYLEYAKRFTGRINRRRNELGLTNIQEDTLIEVKGGIHTASDLAKTKQFILDKDWYANIKLNSSGYQLKRRAIKDFIKNYHLGDVTIIPSEAELPRRHPLYKRVAERVLPIEFVNIMIERNSKIDKYPKYVEHVAAYFVRVVKPVVEKYFGVKKSG